MLQPPETSEQQAWMQIEGVNYTDRNQRDAAYRTAFDLDSRMRIDLPMMTTADKRKLRGTQRVVLKRRLEHSQSDSESDSKSDDNVNVNPMIPNNDESKSISDLVAIVLTAIAMLNRRNVVSVITVTRVNYASVVTKWREKR